MTPVNKDDKYLALADVLRQEFGEDSDMYRDGISAYLASKGLDGKGGEIPVSYRKYWQPYQTSKILHHITIKKNIESIKRDGLQPRDPHPRPWAAMKAIFLGEPGDPLFAKSEQAVMRHVLQKGDEPVLLHIKTDNQLYRSTEPERTFQVISLDPIKPEDIVAYIPIQPSSLS